MTEQRLPRVNSDDGTWGALLLQYLTKEHYNVDSDNSSNGGHQFVTIQPGTAAKAPLTFNSGPVLTTKAAGSMEFLTDNLYFTITTGTVRKTVAMYDDASGATGDTYYRASGGGLTRLGIGSTNQVLKTSSGGLPVWGSASSTFNTAATSGTTYTISATDTVVFASASTASVTVTLPAAASFGGYRFYIKRTDASATNTCTINTAGGNLDGATSVTLNTQYQAIGVVSDGTNWYIL